MVEISRSAILRRAPRENRLKNTSLMLSWSDASSRRGLREERSGFAEFPDCPQNFRTIATLDVLHGIVSMLTSFDEHASSRPRPCVMSFYLSWPTAWAERLTPVPEVLVFERLELSCDSTRGISEPDIANDNSYLNQGDLVPSEEEGTVEMGP